jgi:hypothetical protein
MLNYLQCSPSDFSNSGKVHLPYEAAVAKYPNHFFLSENVNLFKVRLKCGEKYFQNVSLAKDSLNLVLFNLQNVEFEESYTVNTFLWVYCI